MSTAQNEIGPQLPPHFLNKKHESESDTSDSNDSKTGSKPPVDNSTSEFYGPALPPNLYGPALPPNLKAQDLTTIGPALPKDFTASPDESSSDSYVGPSLSEFMGAVESSGDGVAADFERRAEKMKKKLTQTEEPKALAREEWMTELPSVVGKKIGIGARTFNKRAGPSLSESDRSGWTETPLDKRKKPPSDDEEPTVPKLTSEQLATIRKNHELSERLDTFNKTKRSESLMDSHKKKLKKNKQEEGKQTRREFDRDKDLNAGQIDKAFVKGIADKAKLFNSRFSHGSSHFL